MPADIRTIVTCNLGEVISVSISDDYPQETGLITTGGTVVVAMGSSPGLGGTQSGNTNVTVELRTKYGTEQSIQRNMLVLNKTIDPTARTITYDVGCRLRLGRELRDDVFMYADGVVSDESYNGVPEEEIPTTRIKASDVAMVCSGRLGFVPNPCGLQNEFALNRFDLSAGYLQVLNDLLYSESLLYQSNADGSVLVPAEAYTSAAIKPVIIDLKPIGVGRLPGKKVSVSYSRKVLDESQEEPINDEQLLNWEKDETIGARKEVAVPNPLWDNNPFPYVVPEEFIYTYTPRTVTLTKYDAWDRVTERTTTEYTILAEIAPGYLQHIAYWMLYKDENPITEFLTRPAGIGGVSTGSQVYTIVTREIYRYKLSPSAISSGPPPEGYEEVLYQEVTVDEPFIKLIASTTTYSKAGFAGDGFVHFDYKSLNANRFIAKTQAIRSEYARGAEGQQIAKNITTTALAKAYTQRGQQTLAAAMEEIGFVEDDEERIVAILNEYAQLVGQGDEVRITSGREINLQIRPPAVDRLPLSRQSVAQQSDSVELTDIQGTQYKVYFSMPYATDDEFNKVGDNYISVSKEDQVQRRATTLGRKQNALLAGMRGGYNIQVPATSFNPRPAVSSVGLSISGAAAAGQTAGLSWQADANGAILSFDWLVAGGLGGIDAASAWFPLPTTVTSIPPEPATTDTSPAQLVGQVATVGTNAQTTLNTAFPTAVNGDGVFAQDTDEYWVKQSGTWTNVGTSPGEVVDISGGLLPMANELVPAVAQSRTQLVVTSYPYALTLLTSASLTSRTQLVAARVLKVEAPASAINTAAVAPSISLGAAVRPSAAGVSVAAAVPAVSAGASIKPAAVNLALAVAAPAVSTGTSVAVPVQGIGIEAQVPLSAGPPPLVVDVPAANVAVAGVAPAVVTGASVAVPAKDIAVTAQVPSLGDPSFSSVSLLLHMDGSNNSTTFTDSSSNALTATVNGNAKISTADSQFGGASATFDGTGDYISYADNSVFEFGSGNFTVEFWMKTTQSLSSATIIARDDSSFGSGSWTLMFNRASATSGEIAVFAGAYSNFNALLTTTGVNIRDGQWHHVAWVRSGTSHYLFVDGVERASRTSTSLTITDMTVRLYIGADFYLTGRDYSGSLDELRITKGVARYTANFTAPTAAFPNA